MPTVQEARHWLDRWDRQQEIYLTDREERFAVIADVVEATCGPQPLIVDLGVGPGSLAVRLLDRLPGAQVVGIDADPLLLGLARTAYGDRAGLRLVDHDLRLPGWVDALRLDRAPDAFVSTTALHWLTGSELASVYAACGATVRPGGVLVNGDHLHESADRPRLDDLTRTVRRQRAVRVGSAGEEDWDAWWDAVREAPELSELTAMRGPKGVDHQVDDLPTVDDHLHALRGAGFAEAGTVWQHGDDRVVVAVR
ncbi:MAG TPA: class I SAM-dependent methyltransferase [Jatrophihabitantaceae bacterium]|jgi:SAM-dependent methyltransferase